MSNEEQPTIDLATAVPRGQEPEAATQQLASPPAPPPAAPPPPQPESPLRPPRVLAALWVGRAQQFVAIGLGLVFAALLQLRGLSWTASASTWLENVAGKGPLSEAGAVAVLWRRGTAVGLSLGQVASFWHFLVAGGLLALVLLVAWRLRGVAAAGVSLGIFLLWPTTRDLLVTVGAEVPLAAAMLACVLAGLLAWPRPLVSALLLGVGGALLVLVHPLGLVLAIVMALAVLILPLRRGVEPLAGIEPHEGLWPHAVAVPNLTGLLLAVGLVAAAYGHGGFKVAWMHQMTAWRAPAVAPWLGGLGGVPVVGTVVALAVQVPMPLLVLAISAAVGAVRRPTDTTALPSAMVVGSWLALAWLGLPTPGFVDGVALLAPGIALLAGVMVTDVTRELWARGSSGARTGGVVLWFAVLLALLADLRLAAPDRRHLLGHVPGVLATTAGAQPATLRPADLGLMYRRPLATTVLPGHLGGNHLALALRQLHPPLAGVNYGAAFSTDLVLVDRNGGAPVEQLWQQLGKEEACTEDGARCLIRIRHRK